MAPDAKPDAQHQREIERARVLREEAAAFLRGQLPSIPRVVVQLGTGQGGFADLLSDPLKIPYADIPHFRPSTAPFQKGILVYGTVEGKPVLAMQGRLHLYESYTLQEVTFPIRVCHQLGISILVACNGGGASNPEYRPGDLMIIKDHINLLWGNPLVGANDPDLGPRFVDMTDAYSPRIRAIARRLAGELAIPVHEGVYVANVGPTFETPAETRLAFRLGGDIVGMSTVPEVIVARHMAMEAFGLSMVGNMAAGLSSEPLVPPVEPPLSPGFVRLLWAILEEIA
jgi:purine-nucleoside phosphorylase